MDKYFCNPCGYTYDPEKGDPEHGIAPGTICRTTGYALYAVLTNLCLRRLWKHPKLQFT